MFCYNRGKLCRLDDAMMTNSITLDLPDDVSVKVRALAEQRKQSVEQVLLDYLRQLPAPLPSLSPDVQAELDALKQLSDDTLWTITREQLPDDVQNHAQALMRKNNQEVLTAPEQEELEDLVNRADRLMLRKAEAATILRQRGHNVTQKDFKPEDV